METLKFHLEKALWCLLIFIILRCACIGKRWFVIGWSQALNLWDCMNVDEYVQCVNMITTIFIFEPLLFNFLCSTSTFSSVSSAHTHFSIRTVYVYGWTQHIYVYGLVVFMFSFVFVSSQLFTHSHQLTVYKLKQRQYTEHRYTSHMSTFRLCVLIICDICSFCGFSFWSFIIIFFLFIHSFIFFLFHFHRCVCVCQFIVVYSVLLPHQIGHLI